MRKKLLLLTMALSGSTMLNAQWDSVAKFNQVISDIEVYNTDLFIAGNFTQHMSSTCYWSAIWNGTSISTHTSMIGGSGIREMEVFGTDLYCVDALNYGGVIGVGMWNGGSWSDGGSTNYSHGVIYADGADLYVQSDDGKIRKKTGAGPFTLFHDFAGAGGVSSIVRYGTKLIFAGTFTSIGGTPATNIAAWDGVSWSTLGTGIGSGTMCMAVYGTDLYVAGSINTAGGSAVTKIAKWNGTAWSAVGGGVTGGAPNGIRDMKATATGLIVVGDFTQMGGVTTSNVARWNGTAWSGLGLVHPDNFVNCVEEYQGKIYVGTFSFTHAHLFRYNGGVGVEEMNTENDNLSIYPNPAKDMITLATSNITGESTLSVYDVKGCLVMEKQINSGLSDIDISALPSGVFVVKLLNEKTLSVKKFVKE